MKSTTRPTLLSIRNALILTIAATAMFAVTSAATADGPRYAFIYLDDAEAAGSFKDLLAENELEVDLVPLKAATTTDLASYTAIIAGSDVKDAWDAATVDQIRELKKPVLGLGLGGSRLFGRLGLVIGFPMSWHGNDVAVRPMRKGSSFWTSLDFDLPDTNEAILYVENNHVGVYAPKPVKGVVGIGRELRSPSHYAIIEQNGRFLLWGFEGSPRQMTPLGKQLFIHACRYVTLSDEEKLTKAALDAERIAANDSSASAPDSPVTSPPPDYMLFLGCGDAVVGPAKIYQITTTGDLVSSVAITGRALGLARRGTQLIAAMPSVRVGGGQLFAIEDDGSVEPLELKTGFPAPIHLAIDEETQDLLVADNEEHAVFRISSTDPTEVELLFRAPLNSPQDHFPSMSVAATKDRHIAFSASDPKGVFRLPLKRGEILPEPILTGDAGVASDPNSNRWVVMQANQLKVFEETEEKRSIPCADDATFWRYHVMTFAPDGKLFVVLETGVGLEVQSVDLVRGEFTPQFKWDREKIQSMAVGPRMDWK